MNSYFEHEKLSFDKQAPYILNRANVWIVEAHYKTLIIIVLSELCAILSNANRCMYWAIIMLESKSIVRKDFNERAQHNILKDPPALFVPCPHINGKMVKKSM